MPHSNPPRTSSSLLVHHVRSSERLSMMLVKLHSSSVPPRTCSSTFHFISGVEEALAFSLHGKLLFQRSPWVVLLGSFFSLFPCSVSTVLAPPDPDPEFTGSSCVFLFLPVTKYLRRHDRVDRKIWHNMNHKDATSRSTVHKN